MLTNSKDGLTISGLIKAGPFAGFLVGCLLGAFAFFKDFYGFLGGYADQRFLLIASVVLTSPLVFFARSFPSPAALAGWFIFVGSIVVSWALAINNSGYEVVEAVFYPAYLASIAGLSVPFSRTCSNAFEAAVTGLLAAAMAYALLTPAVYLFAIFDGVSRLDKFLPWGFVNIRYWSQVASWILPLLPLGLLVGPLRNYRLWRLGIGITAGIWWWLLFLSSARGSAISIIIGAGVALFLFGRHAKPWFKGLLWQVALGVIVWLILSVQVPVSLVENPEMRGIGTDTSGRLSLWGEAWAMSLVNFPFGMGPQSWLTHDIITPAYETSKKFGHPHNMYLMWAAEYGWLAVIGLGTIGLIGLRRFLAVRIRLRRYELSMARSQLVIALTVSVFAAMIHSGASAVLIAPASMLIGMVVFSLFWSLLTHPEFNAGESVGPVNKEGRLQRLSLAVVAFFVLILWNFEAVRYYKAMRQDELWYAEHVAQGLQPRFWFHGNFPRHPDLMPENEHN